MADDDTRASREEFQEARRALVDMLVAQHPGTTHKTGDGVAISDLAAHYKTAAEQAASAQREAAAAYLKITPEELDARMAGAAEVVETPQSRTADLPTDTPPARLPTPPRGDDAAAGKWGAELIEDAIREEIADLLK